MSFMDRSITVTDEEYNTLMLALDVTAARYEEEAKSKPHMVPRAKQMGVATLERRIEKSGYES